jgi:hypothetical protein
VLRTQTARQRAQREKLLATPAVKGGLSKEQFEMFRASGYKGSSALTWQEAMDFAHSAPWPNTLVCDALGGSADECRMGEKLTGLAGFIYDVFLADIPECATGQADACAGVAASVVPGGGMGKVGKAAEEAAKAAKAGEGAKVLKGPIADAIPKNLPQQLALDAAKEGQGTVIMRNLGDAPRLVANYGDGEWVKMQYVLRGTDSNVTIHYFRNLTTNMDVEFKFK